MQILEPLATGDSPLNVSLAQQTALVYEYLARAQESLGRHDGAIAGWCRSLEVCRGVFGVKPEDPTCRKQQMVDWNGLTPILAAAGDDETALKLAANGAVHEALAR